MPLRFRRHRSFFIGLVAGLVVLVGTLFVLPGYAVVWGANAFFIVYLVSSMLVFPGASAGFLKSHAYEEDAPVWIIFVVTAAVIAAAVVSLFQLLSANDQGDALRLIVTAVSVPLGWFTIHSLAAHHYAYEFYAVPQEGPRGKSGKPARTGGLEFPSGDTPDGISFLYFSYVIGMTAQVADVNITSHQMQRIVLLHGIFSFFFNAVIVAAMVNIVVSLKG
jgi:uncharacterized membrane protein